MGEKAQTWIEKDQKYIWHAMSRHNPNASPMVIAEAKGVWVTDIDGKRYLDGMSGLWCVNIGYGREELAQAASD